MKNVILISIIIVLSSLSLMAQQQQPYNIVIENLIEELSSNAIIQTDFSVIAEDLEYYYQNPIDLNSTTYDELKSLWILSEFQIKSLLEYRNRSGNILSMYELALIDGYNITTVQNMLLFTHLDDGKTTKSISLTKAIKYSHNDLYFKTSTVLENPLGYSSKNDSADNRYLGNKLSMYSRYQMQYKKQFYAGFVMEKDPGEYLFKGENKYGFDFYSAHIQIKDLGIIKNIVLGDFSVQFGQGLIAWSSSSLNGKSPYVMNICKYAKGLKKYSSKNENMFMRGAGITIGTKQLQLTSFASYKNIDANLKYDSTIHNKQFFTSFINTGLHNDEKSLKYKGMVNETIIGANTKFCHSIISVGVSAIVYKFSSPIIKEDRMLYSNTFSGTNNYNISSDFRFMFKGIHLFGEAAMSKNSAKAFLFGSLLNLHENFKVSVLYRNYPKDYQALYSSGFGETGNTQNESGYYIGTEINILKRWKLSGYYDSFSLPWIRSGIDAPSDGNDYLLQADFATSDNVTMYWRYRHKQKSKNNDNSIITNGIPTLYEENKSSIRYQINYKVSDKLELRNRLEMNEVSIENDTEKGFLGYQDIMCSPFHFPLSLSFRYAYFDTPSYLSRIYAYESDVLYSYSVIPYMEKGTRSYIMLRYNISNYINIWIRYAYTLYVEKQIIGSELDEIRGDRKSDIKFQIRITF